MRKYYVHYYRDFSNTYTLRYTETPEQDALAISQGYERITRRQAISLCRDELDLRKYNPSCGGYASDVITPIDYDEDREMPWECNPHMVKVGYIIERI